MKFWKISGYWMLVNVITVFAAIDVWFNESSIVHFWHIEDEYAIN